MKLKNFFWSRKRKSCGGKAAGGNASCGSAAALLRENLKRRTWLFSLLSFVSFCAYPLAAVLFLSRRDIREAKGFLLQENAVELFGFHNAFTVFFLTAGAIFCAMQGFFWLYSRKKVDMYVSQPVSARRRFFVIYGNGILIFFVPFAFALLAGAFAAALMGAGSAALFAQLPFTLLGSLIYFLAVYHVTLIAVMVTGNRGMSVFFTCIFLSYDVVTWYLLESYKDFYFATHVANVASPELFSPVYRMIRMPDAKAMTGVMPVVSEIWKTQMLPMLPGFAILLAEAAVFGVLAYFCYRKRPMESSGRPVVFPAVGSAVKVCLMLSAGLVGSSIFCSVTGSHAFPAAFAGLLLGALFCQAVLEILYAGDLRALFAHKKSFGAGIAAVLVCHLFFALDLSGYDTWVPAAAQVESAALEIDFNNRYQFSYVDEKYRQVWEDYAMEHMEIRDVSCVLSLAADGMGKGAPEQTIGKQLRCTVKYRMKNGREKYRSFLIDYEKEQRVLNILFANEDYKKGVYQVLEERMEPLFKKSEAYYNNGMQEEKVSDINALPLMQAYQADLRDMSFTDVKEEIPVGILKLRYNGPKEEEYTLEYPVFSCYERTMAYLLGKEAALKLEIAPEAVGSVRVICYEEDAEVTEDVTGIWQNAAPVADSRTRTEKYTERTQIRELLQAICPSSLISWAYLRSAVTKNPLEAELSPAGNEAAYRYSWNDPWFVLLPEKAPEFLKEDLGLE